MKRSSIHSPHRVRLGWLSPGLAGLAAALSLLLSPAGRATVLDDFSGSKTGWTDTLNSGSVNQSGGLFIISTATNSGALTYSSKTSASFTNLASHTLEFRVDVTTVSPGGSPNPLAVLAWVPTGGAARYLSGLTVSQFFRRLSLVRYSRPALLRELPHIQRFAAEEGLDAHGRSATLRSEAKPRLRKGCGMNPEG